jgi:hypothetical protein
VPEEAVLNPKHRDARQDVFACGAMLYEVIMGKLPRSSDYEPIEGIHDGFDGIDKVIQDALATERKRTPSAKAMRLQIASLLNA